jgi:hypothetical protein
MGVVSRHTASVRRSECGCIHEADGQVLLVCSLHVKDIEGLANHFRLRGSDGTLRLVPGPPPLEVAGSKERAERSRETLNAIAGMIRAAMPEGVVRSAFSTLLKDLAGIVRDGARRDNFSRGVWAGWGSLATELYTRIDSD